MKCESKLRPHQVEAAKHLCAILASGRSALDASDTGTGKTYTGAAVAAALNVGTVAVVPKISQTAWTRVADYLGTSFDVLGWEKLRTGRTPFGWWEYPYVPKLGYRCTRCLEEFDPERPTECRNQFHGIHCVEVFKRKHNYGRFYWHRGVELILMDEVHRANALKSLNAEMLIGAVRQGIPVLGMSATPACTPLQFRALGYMLGLHKLDGVGGFYPWSRRLGCKPHPRFKGWAWLVGAEKQRETMELLHNAIFPASGVRVRTHEIPGFPRRVIEASLFDLEGVGKIDRLYAEMREAVDQLKERASGDVDPENPLTRMLRARQEIELLKVPIVVELVEDHLAKGQSVAVFVNYAQTIEELSRRLECGYIIDGTRKDRDRVIDAFQRDEAHLILVNSRAGGISVSLHDLRGERGRAGLVMPEPSVVTMRQVFGRLPREGGQSVAYYRIILAAGTAEEDIHRKFVAKSGNLDLLLDSDFAPDGCSVRS